jgi:tetratricopeptide (TPR) repeat protein
MKDEIYQTLRRLIDGRELNEANLDEAEAMLETLVEEDPNCAWAWGLLAEIYYWAGETADAADKLVLFEQGVEYGKQGVAADANSLEANFWLGVNYGLYGAEKGIMQSLALINPIRECLERARAMEESYFYGGPWRGLGRLYHKAPGWPISIGNIQKAVECLETALRFGPKFYLNHLYLAEAYAANRQPDKARERLEWIINAPLSARHEQEDLRYKGDAQAILKKLG